MTSLTVGRVISLMLLFSATGIGQQAKGINADVPTMSFCELLAHSKQYVSRTVSVRVRITATKHGTGIWDPECSGRGADLQWQGSSPGMKKLDEALRKFGMGDYPVIATLTGTWMGQEHTDNGFLLQPRTDF
jgi:hypothetical protein